jgi:hypothetical protein
MVMAHNPAMVWWRRSMDWFVAQFARLARMGDVLPTVLRTEGA